MNFIIEGQPQGKARPKFTKSGHAYTPQATRDYENLIAAKYTEKGGNVMEGYIKIAVDAFYKIPKSFNKEKRGLAERGFLKPMAKPDIDNVIKAILDGLNGVAYYDDKQVVEVVARKHYREEPLVYVEVTTCDEQKG